MPGVTEALHNLRIQGLEAEGKTKEGDRVLYKCALCRKEYTTAKAHANHLESKLHVTRAASSNAPSDAGIAVSMIIVYLWEKYFVNSSLRVFQVPEPFPQITFLFRFYRLEDVIRSCLGCSNFDPFLPSSNYSCYFGTFEDSAVSANVTFTMLLGVAGTRPAPQRLPAIIFQEINTHDDKEISEEVEGSEDEWEEVDEEDISEEEDRDTVVGMDEAGCNEGPLSGHWDPNGCLFCGRSSSNLEVCIEHMHREHGFFIPDVEYLKDTVGMLTYLGLKITKGHMCLYCDELRKQFQSLNAVRTHMIIKSHCKLRYGDGEGIAEEELEVYYDFSSSYKTLESSEIISVDFPAISLSSGGHELVIKGFGDEEGTGKRIGSRDMARYFRQRPAPSDQRNSVMVKALVARYSSMGLATLGQKWRLRNEPEEQQRKASRRAEYIRSKIALKHNVIRNLPRNCEF